jgi:SAM-dependent methyltransferase
MATAPTAPADALAPVADYYSGRLRRHGPTPLGVDWPHRLNQELRFVQLLTLCDFSAPCSLNDVGCGYGALLGHLWRRHRAARIDYLGTDVSAGMVAAARRRWRHRGWAAFEQAADCLRSADYSLASGIFNVKLDCAEQAWEVRVMQSLANLHRHSGRGLAVNFITPARPGSASPPQLYRPPVERWKCWLEQALGLKVTVIDGYGLPEYTLIARS